MGREDKRRHVSREFKRDAVQLVTERGRPMGKVARELDLHPNLLHLWRRKFLAEGDKARQHERGPLNRDNLRPSYHS